MKKQKSNISVKNDLGYKVTPNIIFGDNNTFPTGDLLDANGVIQLIYLLVAGEVLTPGDAISAGGSSGSTGSDPAHAPINKRNITSADIVDGTITAEDFSESVKQAINSVYEEDDETLYMGSLE